MQMMAREKYGEYTLCRDTTLDQSFTLDDGRVAFWFNVAHPWGVSTHVVSELHDAGAGL